MTGHGKTLAIDAENDHETTIAVLKALGSDWRLRILRALGTETHSVNRLAEMLNCPAVTIAMHVKVLEEASMITANLVPANRGLQKVCSRTYDQIVISLPRLEAKSDPEVEIAMPIGAYQSVDALPPCGLATDISLVGMIDDPACFLEPERVNAQILWFRQGSVEYRFPYRVPPRSTPTALQVRMEICSEALTHNEDWPSDITVWINDVEVGTWTSPGDFGGTRGALTPSWWLDVDSQYGLHKRWEVTNSGTFVDGIQVSDVTIRNLGLGPSKGVSVRIGVKADAHHVNGLNLFGRRFGNYPEDLVLRIRYERERR